MTLVVGSPVLGTWNANNVTSDLVAGETVLVAIRYNSDTVTVTSVADDASPPNTYTMVDTYATETFNGARLVVFRSVIATSKVGAVVTATLSSGTGGVSLIRVTGIGAFQVGKATYQTNATSATDSITGPVTPTASPGVLFGFMYTAYGTNTLTGGTGFTDNGALFNPGTAPGRTEYKTITGTSEVSATFTQSRNDAPRAIIVAVVFSQESTGAPTLSAATVTSIGDTTATPRVTITF